MKLMATIIPTNLVANSLLSLFFLALETKNKIQVTRNISAFFIAFRESRSTSKPYQIQDIFTK